MNTALRPMYKWETVKWPKAERAVYKLQKRIYRAAERGNRTATCGKRRKRAAGVRDQHRTIEEPCVMKVARTVLQQGRGERSPRLL